MRDPSSSIPCYRPTAAQMIVTWLDVYAAFLHTDVTGDSDFFKDGMRPNAAGYA